jgi:predicted ribosomally synthesized peptide with SipW-like signal peptide
MAISNKKKAVAVAAILAGSIGLVSIGSSAVFTDTVTAESTVKAGTAKIAIEADGWTITDNGHAATLDEPLLIKSSTDEIDVPLDNSNLTVWNRGDIPVAFAPSVARTGDLDVQVSFVRTGGDTDGSDTVAPGHYVQYRVVIKATNLGNESSGKTAKVTFRVNATA